MHFNTVLDGFRSHVVVFADRSFKPCVDRPELFPLFINRCSCFRVGGNFMAAHDRWIVEGHIDTNSRSRHEHRVLSRTLDLAYAEDGWNLLRSSAAEYLNRRRQLIEEAHRENPAKPDFSSSHLWMGEDDEGGGAHMSSALRARVAQEMGREAAIAKERRKTAEAKSVGRPHGKGAKKGGTQPEG